MSNQNCFFYLKIVYTFSLKTLIVGTVCSGVGLGIGGLWVTWGGSSGKGGSSSRLLSGDGVSLFLGADTPEVDGLSGNPIRL